ncbi:MAG: alpha/beta fold hydrolase [Leptospiraceae bacterium]|nr:alpha/beta fold hydrolase [Leptospiraceae bacterium]MCP5503153.1 alpha/beta fold hydrolase [Leptospiraceae bacterium]
MRTKHSYTEAIDGQQTVEYYRHLHEVRTKDGMKLVMTQKIPVNQKPKASVMLVHGLGQNRYTWTQTKRSFEHFLVANGFQTFNVELRGHGMSRANGSEHPESFECYLNWDIPAFIEEITELSHDKKIFYIGHSLGATISYCIGADFQDKLAGIIGIAGPYNMGKGNPYMKALGQSLEGLKGIIPLHRILPETFYIDLIGLLASHGLELIDNDSFPIPVHVWYPESIERDILKERVRRGFDRTSLSVVSLLIEWTAKGRLFNSENNRDYEKHIEDIQIPFCFIAGNDDYVVSPEDVNEAYLKAGSNDKVFKIFGSKDTFPKFGHIDLISGKAAPANSWKYMLEWLDSRI